MADVAVRVLGSWTCNGCEIAYLGDQEKLREQALSHLNMWQNDRDGDHWKAASEAAGARVLVGRRGTVFLVEIDGAR